jgi:hypothetical protein
MSNFANPEKQKGGSEAPPRQADEFIMVLIIEDHARFIPLALFGSAPRFATRVVLVEVPLGTTEK